MSEENTNPAPVVLIEDTPYTAEALARRLQGSITAEGGEVTKDEDTAIAALAGFDAATQFSSMMDADQMQDFVDSFVEAWIAQA
jgi:hypothetical protein